MSDHHLCSANAVGCNTTLSKNNIQVLAVDVSSAYHAPRSACTQSQQIVLQSYLAIAVTEIYADRAQDREPVMVFFVSEVRGLSSYLLSICEQTD